jgi:hypothetical protein
MRKSIASICLLATLCALPFCSSGCALAGVLASKAMIIRVKPSYTGLAGQSLTVYVAADSGLRNDYPTLQFDLANGSYTKLQAAAPVAEELKGTQFPRERGPQAVLAFQHNYPEMMFDPITKIAPKLGVTRVIYIDVEKVETHPEAVPELFRGTIAGRVQVIEVTNGVGKMVYEEHVEVIYPEKLQQATEGLPDLGEEKTYRGAVELFTSAVLQKFVTHDEAG